jgi:hypothetical protein
LSYPESSQAPIKRVAIPAVPVTNEIPRRIPIPATGVHDLLSRPVGGGMSAGSAESVVHHEKDVQRPEEDRPHPEEVARPDIRGMACQQLPPSGRGDAVIGPPHILGDGPGRHRKSEPRELCLDTSLSPQAILDGHAPDQGPQGPLQGRPTAPLSLPGPPPPIGRPLPVMPAEHELVDRRGMVSSPHRRRRSRRSGTKG